MFVHFYSVHIPNAPRLSQAYMLNVCSHYASNYVFRYSAM